MTLDVESFMHYLDNLINILSYVLPAMSCTELV